MDILSLDNQLNGVGSQTGPVVTKVKIQPLVHFTVTVENGQIFTPPSNLPPRSSSSSSDDSDLTPVGKTDEGSGSGSDNILNEVLGGAGSVLGEYGLDGSSLMSLTGLSADDMYGFGSSLVSDKLSELVGADISAYQDEMEAALALAKNKFKKPADKQEEIKQQGEDMMEDTKQKCQKFIKKIDQLMKTLTMLQQYASAIMEATGLGNTGLNKALKKVDKYNPYKFGAAKNQVWDTVGKIDQIRSTVNSAKNQVKNMKRDAQKMESFFSNPQNLMQNPLASVSQISGTISGSAQKAVNSIDSAFNSVDNVLDIVNDNFLSNPLIPSKIQDKISQKELNRKIKEAQEKLQEWKETAEEWIKTRTAKVTGWIAKAQKSATDEIAKQQKRAANAVAAFSGIDPEVLEKLIEQIEAMAYDALMAKIKGQKYDISTQLDILKKQAEKVAKDQLKKISKRVAEKIANDEKVEWGDLILKMDDIEEQLDQLEDEELLSSIGVGEQYGMDGIPGVMGDEDMFNSMYGDIITENTPAKQKEKPVSDHDREMEERRRQRELMDQAAQRAYDKWNSSLSAAQQAALNSYMWSRMGNKNAVPPIELFSTPSMIP